MPENSLTDPTPQFGTAEYAGTPGADRCKSCQQGIAGYYYRINGAMTCASCAEKAKRLLPQDSHASFVRGLLFGIGGAILGLILYATFGIVTGLMVGYVSLAVGYIVGKAIMMGSRGIGGRRYQIAAALLTYFAVSVAAVPIWMSQLPKSQMTKKQAGDGQSRPEPDASRQAAPPGDATAPEQANPSEKPKMRLAVALGALLLIGLASPFLELQSPLHGLIGLVILFVGVNIAWKLAAGTRIEIFGPFNNPSPASGQPAAG